VLAHGAGLVVVDAHPLGELTDLRLQLLVVLLGGGPFGELVDALAQR